MCYEETLFQRWARKRAQRREQAKPVGEQTPPTRQPAEPALSPTAKKPKEIDRELETV